MRAEVIDSENIPERTVLVGCALSSANGARLHVVVVQRRLNLKWRGGIGLSRTSNDCSHQKNINRIWMDHDKASFA